jgi:hypothetical protein
VRKAFVTFADELAPTLGPLLQRYGFVTEGVSAGRYRPGSGERVMGKTFAPQRVGADNLVDFIVDHMVREHGGEVLSQQEDTLEVVVPHGTLAGLLAQVPFRLAISSSATPEADYEAAASRLDGARWLFVSLYGKPANVEHWSHRVGNWIDGEDLMARFYPVELITPQQPSLVCTIRPAYANGLMPDVNKPPLFSPERLQIRPDNVYYRSPDRFKPLRRGSRLLFYVSAPEMRLRGSARLQSLRLGTPAELLEHYGTMGILDFQSIQNIADHHGGNALALIFDWYAQHKRQVGLSDIKAAVGRFNPITATLVTHDEVRQLLSVSLAS